MQQQYIDQIANQLNQARVNAAPVEQFSSNLEAGVTFDQMDTYSIQEQGIQYRQSQGEKLVGLKMGLTSEAKRKQMDLDSPLYGELTDKMQIQNGGTFTMTGSIHPKIEPEVAFYFESELEGEMSRDQVLEKCSAVYCALEILDSRYQQFKYFSMEDVISDNSSSSHFVLGEKIENFQEIDLVNLKMEMFVNGELAQSGSSKAISDDPVLSVVQLLELLAKRGRKLPAGSIVLAGAATAAVQLEEGMKIELKVESLGDCSVKVEK